MNYKKGIITYAKMKKKTCKNMYCQLQGQILFLFRYKKTACRP